MNFILCAGEPMDIHPGNSSAAKLLFNSNSHNHKHVCKATFEVVNTFVN